MSVRGDNGQMVSLASRLPFWVTRRVKTSKGSTVDVLILKDGTMVIGLLVNGLDVFTKVDGVLNRISGNLKDAVNTLPSGFFVQAIFENGLDYKDIIEQYQKVLALEGDDLSILGKSRQLRAELYRGKKLSRGEVTYWLGQVNALGKIEHQPGLFGRKNPVAGITRDRVVRAATELKVAVDNFCDHLSSAGITTREMNESEVVQKIFRAVSPVTSEQVGPPVIVETAEESKQAGRETPKVFRGPGLSAQVVSGPVVWDTHELMVDDPPLRERVLYLQRMPFATTPDWLFPLQFASAPETPYRLVITHLATEQQLSKEKLTRQRNLLQSRLGGSATNHDAIAALRDFEGLLEQMASTGARVFQSSILAVVTGKDAEELDEATRTIKKGFSQINSVASTATNVQSQGWLSALPGNGYRSPKKYPLVSGNCGHLLPYFVPDTGGKVFCDFLFENRQGGVFKTSWRQSGGADVQNTVILGETGSGKTFLISHIFKTILSLGGHVIITDVKGPKNSTYLPTSELLGGQYIALDATDRNIAFNPCPAREDALDREGKLSALTDDLVKIVCMMCVPDLDRNRDKDIYMRVATDALNDVYVQRKLERPRLSHVVTGLRAVVTSGYEFPKIAEDMATRLQLWCDHRKRGALLNTDKSFTSDNPLQIYDFFGLEEDKELAAVLISTLSSQIYQKLQKLPLDTPKAIFFDEAWSFFDHSEVAAALVGNLFRVVRSYGAACFVASQSYRDVAQSRAATAMMANVMIYLFNRFPTGHEEIGQAFGLSEREVHLLKSLQMRKGEFAEHLRVDRNFGTSAVLRYSPTPYELWIDTSKASDMAFRQKIIEKAGGDKLKAINYLAKKFPNGAPKEASNE